MMFSACQNPEIVPGRAPARAGLLRILVFWRVRLDCDALQFILWWECIVFLMFRALLHFGLLFSGFHELNYFQKITNSGGLWNKLTGLKIQPCAGETVEHAEMPAALARLLPPEHGRLVQQKVTKNGPTLRNAWKSTGFELPVFCSDLCPRQTFQDSRLAWTRKYWK